MNSQPKPLSPDGKDAIRRWIVAGIKDSAIGTDGEREALPWVLSGGLDCLLDAERAARPDRRDFVEALLSSSAPPEWNDAITAALNVLDGGDTIVNLYAERAALPDALREAARTVVDAKPMDWGVTSAGSIDVPERVFDALMDTIDALDAALASSPAPAPDSERLREVVTREEFSEALERIDLIWQHAVQDMPDDGRKILGDGIYGPALDVLYRVSAAPALDALHGTVYNVIGGSRLTVTLEVEDGTTHEEAMRRFPIGSRAALASPAPDAERLREALDAALADAARYRRTLAIISLDSTDPVSARRAREVIEATDAAAGGGEAG